MAMIGHVGAGKEVVFQVSGDPVISPSLSLCG